jgi:hypothetical protein
LYPISSHIVYYLPINTGGQVRWLGILPWKFYHHVEGKSRDQDLETKEAVIARSDEVGAVYGSPLPSKVQ